MEDDLLLRLMVTAQPLDDFGHPNAMITAVNDGQAIMHNLSVADDVACISTFGWNRNRGSWSSIRFERG